MIYCKKITLLDIYLSLFFKNTFMVSKFICVRVNSYAFIVIVVTYTLLLFDLRESKDHRCCAQIYGWIFFSFQKTVGYMLLTYSFLQNTIESTKINSFSTRQNQRTLVEQWSHEQHTSNC